MPLGAWPEPGAGAAIRAPLRKPRPQHRRRLLDEGGRASRLVPPAPDRSGRLPAGSISAGSSEWRGHEDGGRRGAGGAALERSWPRRAAGQLGADARLFSASGRPGQDVAGPHAGRRRGHHRYVRTGGLLHPCEPLGGLGSRARSCPHLPVPSLQARRTSSSGRWTGEALSTVPGPCCVSCSVPGLSRALPLRPPCCPSRFESNKG